MPSQTPPPGSPQPQPDHGEGGIFLSPRVIDQTAFVRYTESLRSLIEDAAAKARSLEQGARRAEESIGTVGEVLEELRTKMETAVRLIPTLEQRAEQARSVVGELGDFGALREELAASFDARLREIAEARSAEAAETIEALTAERVERARLAGQRVEEAATRLDALADAAETRVQERIAQLEGEAQEAEARSLDAAGRVESSAAALDERVGELRGRLEETSAEISSASDAVAQLGARTGEAEAAVDGLARRAETIIAEAGLERVEAARDAAQRAASSLAETIGRAEAMADRSREDSLARVVERAEGLDGSALAAREELRSLTEQAERARSLLAENLLEAIDQIDRLDAERERLVSSVGASVETLRSRAPEIETGVSELERRVETIRGAVETLSSRSTRAGEEAQSLGDRLGELVASTRREAASFEERAEQIGEWLATLITRAEQAAGHGEASGGSPEVRVVARPQKASSSAKASTKKAAKKASKKAAKRSASGSSGRLAGRPAASDRTASNRSPADGRSGDGPDGG